jgi:hypothetical protein
MTPQPTAPSTNARRTLRLAPIWLAALAVSIGLPATASAQLNQSLRQVDNATNDAFFVRGTKRMLPDE